MTLSGFWIDNLKRWVEKVLIPLLVDDPLWEFKIIFSSPASKVLIPLLVDDPLWERLSTREPHAANTS